MRHRARRGRERPAGRCGRDRRRSSPPPGTAPWRGPRRYGAVRTAAGGRGPTTPTRPGERALPGPAVAAARRPRAPAPSSTPCRTPGCAAWAARAFPTGQQVGAGRGAAGRPEVRHLQRRRVRARARSRTARSWPSSRTWCSRGCCSGMVVVGAEEGWVFIRHEYGPEEEVLRERDRGAARGRAWSATDVDGSGRRLSVEVFTSPGGYILGEESALIECMEGHRGEPRNKPPFPGTYGLWGRPTLMNSVETFADVPVIVERGAPWWRDQGVGGSTGLKFFAVSGHVERPGRLLRADGHHGRRPDRRGRRDGRRRRARRGAAGRRVVELPRPRPPRRPSGLRDRWRRPGPCSGPAPWW